MKINYVNFYTGQIVDNYIYASQSFFNGLIKIDLCNNVASYIAEFPKEKKIIPVLHRFSYLYNRKIFFIPCNANNLAVFDVDNSSLEMIDLKGTGYNLKCYFVIDNKLWLIPVSGGGDVLIVDMDTYDIEVCNNTEYPFGGATIINICQDNDRIYYGKYDDNTLVTYDVRKRIKNTKKVRISNIHTVSKGKNGIWIIGQENDSFLCVEDEKEYSYPLKKKYGCFVNILDLEIGVCAIPYRQDAFLIKETNANYFEEVDMSKLDIKKIHKNEGVYSYDIIDTGDYWIVPPYNINKMLLISKEDGKIIDRTLSFKDEVDIPDSEIRNEMSSEVFFEGFPVDLQNYVNII